MAGLAIAPNPIVTVNVSTILAPAVPTYQQTGALVSFGGTNLTPNSSAFLTQFSDLTPLLRNGGGISAAVWAGATGTITAASYNAGTGLVTLTVTGTLPVSSPNTFTTTITGLVPAALNGQVLATVVSATSITYPLAVAPGTITTPTGNWNYGQVTATINGTLPTYVTVGSSIHLLINGLLPIAYNGEVTALVVSATSISYPLAANPGTATPPVLGNWQIYNTNQINAQASTWFRQGSGVGAYVLELGYQPTFAAEITAIETWLTNSPLSYYGYLLPDYWGSIANIPAALTMYNQFTNPEAMTYFWTTIDLGAVGMIANTVKSVVQLVESPGVKNARKLSTVGNYTEFTLAAMFFWGMQFKATSVTRVSPMCFKFVFGVTAYPTSGNGPVLVTFKTNNVNYIQTGAEGGIAFTNVYQGVTADGKDYFNWWWTIDWVQIQINIDLSNAIINGSNNPLAPLYYNQPGINTLQAVLAGTMQRGVGYGMVLGVVNQTEYNSTDLSAAIAQNVFTGTCNVNAVPFIPYSIQNPSDYGDGEYDGLSTLFIPSRGFVHILVQVVATDIVTL
jgi:hypothetical protein